ncbi:hypothetical protein ABZ891_22965 [Streptomyces sp. NPDC047023]
MSQSSTHTARIIRPASTSYGPAVLDRVLAALSIESLNTVWAAR